MVWIRAPVTTNVYIIFSWHDSCLLAALPNAKYVLGNTKGEPDEGSPKPPNSTSSDDNGGSKKVFDPSGQLYL